MYGIKNIDMTVGTLIWKKISSKKYIFDTNIVSTTNKPDIIDKLREYNIDSIKFFII